MARIELEITGDASGLEQAAKKASAATNGLTKATGMSREEIAKWDAAARRNQRTSIGRDNQLKASATLTRQQATETAKATVEVNKSTDSLIRHVYAQRAALSASNNLTRSFTLLSAGGSAAALTAGVAARQIALLGVTSMGAAGGVRALGAAFLGGGGWIIALSVAATALTTYIANQREAKKSTDALATSTSVLHHALAGSDYKTAVKNITELKTNIELARDGLINKRDVVNQYNKAIGDVTGKLNTFSQVEKFITDNSDAYIKAMLLRSAATLALERAAEESFKAQQALNRTDEESVGFWSSGLANSNDPMVMQQYRDNAEKNRQTIASEHQKDQEKFEKIASDLQKQAAEIAKQFNFNLFGEASKGIASESEKAMKRLQDSLDKLRQESIQASLSGYQKELQASQHKYDELTRQAEEFYRAGKVSAKEYAETIARYQGFRVGASGRIIQGAGSNAVPLGQGRPSTTGVVPVNIAQTAVVDMTTDPVWDKFVEDLDKQLSRSVQHFGRDFLRTLSTINQQANVTFGGIVSTLVGSLTGGITEVFSTIFTQKLSDAVQSSFRGMGEKLSSIVAGIGIAGSVVSGAFKPTSIGGQALGGALSAGAVGASMGGPIGAVIGGAIGAISGALGASSAKKIQEQQLAEQRKQTALLERQNALAYASQIMGQMTAGGAVTGIMRDAFGQLVATVKGSDLQFVLQRSGGQR